MHDVVALQAGLAVNVDSVQMQSLGGVQWCKCRRRFLSIRPQLSRLGPPRHLFGKDFDFGCVSVQVVFKERIYKQDVEHTDVHHEYKDKDVPA